MPDPKITEQFRKNFSEILGIRPNHAIDVVNHPDQTDSFEFHGLVILVHSKWIEKSTPPHHLVVLERFEDKGNVIESAFKVYPDIADDIEGKTPSEMFECVIERFGAEIRVGETTSKLIQGESIPITNKEDVSLVAGNAAESGKPFAIFHIMIEDGPPMVARCALCFCLQAGLYLEWLNEHR